MNLGPQFEQTSLPGMPRAQTPLPTLASSNPKHEATEYRRARGSYVGNPVPRSSQARPMGYAREHYLDPNFEKDQWDPSSIAQVTEEFIPTTALRSDQDRVSRVAVQHQLENANPLRLDEDPVALRYEGSDGVEYGILDGNHRAAAALARGQLLMPARVIEDTDREGYYDTDPFY